MEPLTVTEQSPWSIYDEQLWALGDQRQRTTGTLNSFNGPGLSAFPQTKAEALKTCGSDEGSLGIGEEEECRKNREKGRAGKRGKNVSFPWQAVSNLLFSPPFGSQHNALCTLSTHTNQLLNWLKREQGEKEWEGNGDKSDRKGINKTLCIQRTQETCLTPPSTDATLGFRVQWLSRGAEPMVAPSAP